ncbi:uncharacterized protein LOC115047075 [Echeneis naucrates]|uniref:uncharacterized protein LOC115047075 n=1 Tax=Echeneis naucrates TaxID=173247 RepID=UPI0011135230|nr:uncharacterized protein LOC115047075 [Echeneis naucrates]
MLFHSTHPLELKHVKQSGFYLKEILEKKKKCVKEETMVVCQPFGEGTQHAFSWVSVIWFTSALCIAGSQVVQLQLSPTVVTQCGRNVTLTCNSSSSQQMEILSFSWEHGNKTLCPYEKAQTDQDVRCEHKNDHLHHRLTLVLTNVMPVDSGKYICKLRSNQGAKSAVTSVTVQDCLESYVSETNKSHAMCSFTGVYPRGTIHWFKENLADFNLSDSASTWEEKDQHGRYKLSSELQMEEAMPSSSYSCSLWIPSARKYLFSHLKIPSSGSMVKLQWICVMVGLIMVIFMK